MSLLYFQLNKYKPVVHDDESQYPCEYYDQLHVDSFYFNPIHVALGSWEAILS